MNASFFFHPPPNKSAMAVFTIDPLGIALGSVPLDFYVHVEFRSDFPSRHSNHTNKS
jgi:hypothetical protein